MKSAEHQPAAVHAELGRVVGGPADHGVVVAVRLRDDLDAGEVGQGQVLAAIVGPMNAVVGLFTAPLRDLVNVLDARIQQVEEQEA